MAIKMKKAYSTIKNDEVSAKYVEEHKELKKGLECHICRISVSHKIGHPRVGRWVPAHFTRKPGKDHKEGCRYNTVGQVTTIAKDSDDKILESVKSNKFTFRLTMIHEPLKELGGQNANSTNNNGTTTPRKDRKYITKGRLNSYLATMKKILELRKAVENDESNELESIVEIQMHGKKVKWSNFYYDQAKYLDAYNYLQTLKNKRHPICIEGVVRDIRPLKQGDRYAVNLQFGKKDKDIEYIPAVSIFINKDVIPSENFEPGQHIVICALCTTNEGEQKDDNGKVINKYSNIRASLYHENQLIIFKENEEL
ncbi:hypothetical protein [Bacillus wiedmannii]|uniref:hypothetical protein n=1 Tax=Bacillus wiedmannii TaxID=1890302 RepID=UPI0006DA8DF1|nr:hypothetical protein [Bacillus wiedmannii]KPU58211.1 hypothetical protein AN402_5076 [Bacillus wiedmannii]PRT34897.1 hypothetical protein C6358_11640 [Bacillus wiedmannii]PRT46167.1 hypothetical protein C6359_11700 [Bacillus wiedmannii]